MTASSPPRRFRLSEDWLATIIGLVIVGVVGLGLLGPGAQKHELKAAAGEDANAYALPLAGWKISATVDGEKSDDCRCSNHAGAGKRDGFHLRGWGVAARPRTGGDDFGAARRRQSDAAAGQPV